MRESCFISVQRLVKCLFFLSVALLNAAELDGQEKDVDFARLISQLSGDHPVETRVNSASILGNHAQDPRSLNAIAALTDNLKDENPDVRFEAAMNLTFILKAHRREFPLEMLELFDDPSPKIKANLDLLVDFFETYPPEAFEFFLRRYEKLTEDQKSDSLVLLAKAGGKDKRVMQILWNAVNRNDGRFRINAIAGLWAATKDLELVLPLYFDLLADIDKIRTVPANDNGTVTGSNPKFIIGLAEFSIPMNFFHHLAERHDDFVKALRGFSASRSGKTREHLAGYINRCLEFANRNREVEVDNRIMLPDGVVEQS